MNYRVHVGRIFDWLIIASLSCTALACVDGAAKDELGAAQFGASTTPPGATRFAPRDVSTTAVAGEDGMNALGQTEGMSGNAAPKQGTDMGTGGQSSMLGSGGTMPSNGAGGSTGKGSGGSGGGTGSGGAQGSAGSAGVRDAGSAPDPSASSAGTLTVAFMTVSAGGRYAPRNVGAVWIEDGTGKFVKTLEHWAGIRGSHLTTWDAASGGWGSFFSAGNTADMMDAISRATLSRHEMHTLTWDMKGVDGKLVPDGKYSITIELADDNFAASATANAMFEKGPTAQMLQPAAQAPWSGLVVTYQP